MYEGFNYPIKSMETNVLKVTKERVLAASEKCSDAKRVLQELFPEVFEEKQIRLKAGQKYRNEYITIILNKWCFGDIWILTGHKFNYNDCWSGGTGEYNGNKIDGFYTSQDVIDLIKSHNLNLIK